MNSIRLVMRALFPAAMRRFLSNTASVVRILGLSLADALSYLKYSATVGDPCSNEESLEARITANCHVLEKGLTFTTPRPGFGRAVAHHLLRLLESYRIRYANIESHAFNSALSTLVSYCDFNEKQGHEMKDIRAALLELSGNIQPGGTISISRMQQMEKSSAPFPEFCRSRRSIRNFSNESVNVADLYHAIEMAQTAPSVCNRQSSRVYIVGKRNFIASLLAEQGGCRGFEDRADKVLVLTSTLHAFDGINERNQCFVDGGIYAMNLLYGLHAVGLGACPLIWGGKDASDRIIRKKLGIPSSEKIILMIAVGNLPEQTDIPESKRYPVEAICRNVD